MSILHPIIINHLNDYINFREKMKKKAEENIISKLWCVYSENRKPKWYTLFGLIKKNFMKDSRWEACILVDHGHYGAVYSNLKFDRLELPFEWANF